MHELSPADPTPRVRDLGEFGLIQRLRERIEARRPTSAERLLEIGIGDDAAVWLPSGRARQVITTDALVQDVHFRLSTTNWRDLGWKSLAVNVSDLAAMGATPRYVLVTLGLPSEVPLADILELYDGMLDLGQEYGVEIVGGDVVGSRIMFLSVTAIGEASGELLRRDAGRTGDLVAVTGTLGASLGGLRLLELGQAGPECHSPLVRAHLRPRPRVAEAQALVEAGVRCAIDLSDGLLGDLGHICECSGVGAVLDLECVPADPALLVEFGDETPLMALAGGEDYELLCAGRADVIHRATEVLASIGVALTVVGRLVSAPSDGDLVTVLDTEGRRLRPDRLSWDHFRG